MGAIPADVMTTLMRTGTLPPDDFLGTQIYRLADGPTVPSTRPASVKKAVEGSPRIKAA
jgi:hypothetical protein